MNNSVRALYLLCALILLIISSDVVGQQEDENVRTVVEYSVNEQGKRVKVCFPGKCSVIEPNFMNFLDQDYAQDQANTTKICRGPPSRRASEMGQVWRGERETSGARSGNDYGRRERLFNSVCRQQGLRKSPSRQLNLHLIIFTRPVKQSNRKRKNPPNLSLEEKLSVGCVRVIISLPSVLTRILSVVWKMLEVCFRAILL